MKLQGKMTGALAGFVGYIDDTPAIDTQTGSFMLTIKYKDAGVTRYKDYKTIAEFNADWEDYTEQDPPAEPEPGYLVAKIQKLENSVKTLDERLKTAEEITERLLREDNDRIIGKVKPYEPSFCFEHNQDKPCKVCAEKDRKLPPHEEFKRMKQELRDWIEKEPRADKIKAWFVENEETGEKGVEFEAMNRGLGATLDLYNWPRIGLKNGAEYTAEELLITGEAGEE